MKPRIALAITVVVLVPMIAVTEVMQSSAKVPTATPRPVRAPLVGARLVCPDVVDRTVGRVSRITRLGVAVPARPSTVSPAAPTGAGVVRLTPLRAKGGVAPPVLNQAGQARILGGSRYQSDVVVDASGSLAPGLAADELGRRDSGAYRGLDGVACTAPSDSAWLIGASTTVGAHTELHLTNTDDAAALVDIGLFGPSGPIAAHNAVGLAVEPHSTRVIALETLAPAQTELMVNVRARSGRVAVALRQQLQAASTPLGIDWIPLSQPPARTTVVPGLPSGPGPRRLVLGNPGDIDATATIRLIRGDASFVPRGSSSITVPAGSVVSVDITKALAEKLGAALVTADHSIVAGAVMSTGPRVNGFAEQAFSAGTPPLTGPSQAIVNYLPGGVAAQFASALLLTAPTRAANVRIATLGGAGPRQESVATVHIPAGRTAGYPLVLLAHNAPIVAVTVTPMPGSGPVYAARSEFDAGSHGPMFTVLPLVTPPQVATIPPAAIDLRTGLPQ
jgi:hypothetical protein